MIDNRQVALIRRHGAMGKAVKIYAYLGCERGGMGTWVYIITVHVDIVSLPSSMISVLTVSHLVLLGCY